jgi:hypothetical protein
LVALDRDGGGAVFQIRLPLGATDDECHRT